MSQRDRAELRRETKETTVAVSLVVDGSGTTECRRRVSRSSTTCSNSSASTRASTSTIEAKGDLDVDLHHTVEDVGIVLGNALREALGDKRGVRRFANALVPLDEALVEVALDLSGSPVPRLRTSTRSRSGSAPSTRSSPRSSGRASSTVRASRCTCAASAARTATT